MNGSFIIRSSSILLALLLLGLSLNAQRPSKEELDLETLYIDATRSKLLGKYEEAIATFKKILEEDDKNDVVYFELAKIYLQTKAPNEALGAIKKAVAIEPKNIWYQEELAAAHAANDDFVAAAEVYRGLISQRSGEEKFYYDLAFYHVKNNDIKEAIGVFDQHEKRFGVSEEVIGRKFNLYKTLNDSSKAENELGKLVKAFPNDSSYALGLAKFYEDLNNVAKAKSTYQKILRIEPENVEAQVALNNLNGGRAQETAETIWSDPNINIDIKISKIIPAINGLRKASPEKRQQIIDITKKMTEIHPSEAKAFAVHGDVLNFSDRTEEAILAYEGALKLEKNIFSVWNQLLYLYKESYQMKKLLDKSEKALGYFPNEASVYYLNGLAANNLTKYTDALSTLMQADIMSKSDKVINAKVKVALASAYAGLGKKEKVGPLLDAAIKQSPNDIELLTQASEAYIAMGNLMSVEELFMRGLKAQPNQWQVLYLSAKLAYANGDYSKAKAVLIKATAPKGAFHVNELMGDILFQEGDVDGAVDQWKLSKSAGNPNRNLTKKISSRQI